MYKNTEVLQRIAQSKVSVLITGESGVGKEVLAKKLHLLSGRKDEAFVAVNCAAIPDSLADAEFFGSRKGSYTGADKDRVGLFEESNNGTLFLDEIGELNSQLQTKLLRVLQEQEIRRVGDTKTKTLDIRVIAATNRCLLTEVENSRFREDLYYRLNVVSIEIPPLRERKDEFDEIFQEVWKKVGGDKNLEISEFALKLLREAPWPGNIRQLMNVLERACILADGKLSHEDLPEEFRSSKVKGTLDYRFNWSSKTLPQMLSSAEKAIVNECFLQNQKDLKKTAKLLGVSVAEVRSNVEKK